MNSGPSSSANSWAESAIEVACRRAEEWYRALPLFAPRVNLGNVIGHRHPAILSERDCVIHFARFLNEAGVPWDAIHHEVLVSRWLFDKPHPAATALTPGERRRRVDLVLVETEDFLAAHLPALEGGFQFDAFIEFKYLSDYWKVPRARVYGGDPLRGRNQVEKDVDKIGRHLASAACRVGYVIVFEECDWRFPSTFALEAEMSHGCKVRFIRSYSRACPNPSASQNQSRQSSGACLGRSLNSNNAKAS